MLVSSREGTKVESTHVMIRVLKMLLPFRLLQIMADRKAEIISKQNNSVVVSRVVVVLRAPAPRRKAPPFLRGAGARDYCR